MRKTLRFRQTSSHVRHRRPSAAAFVNADDNLGFHNATTHLLKEHSTGLLGSAAPLLMDRSGLISQNAGRATSRTGNGNGNGNVAQQTLAVRPRVFAESSC